MAATLHGSTRDIARTAARAAVRAELAQVALDLFSRQSFGEVTINDLAAAAGVSRSTFLRYFDSKEDAVLAAYDAQGEQLASALRARPTSEDEWTALRRALDILVEKCEWDPATTLAIARLVQGTPALRAGFLEKQLAWRRGLADVLTERAHPARRGPMAAPVLVVAALGCMNVATDEWIASDGELDLGNLLDDAFAVFLPA